MILWLSIIIPPVMPAHTSFHHWSQTGFLNDLYTFFVEDGQHLLIANIHCKSSEPETPSFSKFRQCISFRSSVVKYYVKNIFGIRYQMI